MSDRRQRNAERLLRTAALIPVLDRLVTRALEVSSPIYAVGRGGNPEAVASAVLLASEKSRFLVSAAHVRTRFDGPLYAGTPGRLVQVVGDGLLARSGASSEGNDNVDLWIVRLSGAGWGDVPESAFLRPDELDRAPAIPQRDAFGVLAYPASLSELQGSELRAYGVRIMGVEARQEKYGRLGLDPEMNLVVGYDYRKVWTAKGRETMTKIHGGSGGGIWRFTAAGGAEPVNPPKLSAILTEWHSKTTNGHYLLATRLGPALQKVAQHEPDFDELRLLDTL